MKTSSLFKNALVALAIAGVVMIAPLTNKVFAQSTGTFLGENIMTATNNTTGNGTFSDPVSVAPGDVIEFVVIAQNQTPGVTINNVKVTANLSSNHVTIPVASVTVSGDNASSVSDTVTVNVTNGSAQGFSYISGHVRIFSSSCPSGCSGPDTITSTGVLVGNLGQGESAQVFFKAYLTNTIVITPSPSASPTTSPTPTTVQPTATPTPTRVQPTATPTPTGLPVPTVTPTPLPGGGNNNSNNNDNRSGSNASSNSNPVINVNQSNTQTVNLPPSGGGTGVVAPVKAVAGTSTVSQLPKTGLPAAAWVLSGLLPAGLGLRRFAGRGEGQKQTDSAQFICQQREYEKD